MNTGSKRDPEITGPARAFDERLRAIHAAAVAATPAHVRLQLRPRRAARADAVRGWSMAAAFAVGLVAVGLLWQRPSTPPGNVAALAGATSQAPSSNQSAPQAVVDVDDAYAALDESPALYLWLASSDADAMLGADPSITAGDGGAVTE